MKAFSEMFNEEGIRNVLEESYPDMSNEVDFESFLKVSFVSFLFSTLVFLKYFEHI